MCAFRKPIGLSGFPVRPFYYFFENQFKAVERQDAYQRGSQVIAQYFIRPECFNRYLSNIGTSGVTRLIFFIGKNH